MYGGDVNGGGCHGGGCVAVVVVFFASTQLNGCVIVIGLSSLLPLLLFNEIH